VGAAGITEASFLEKKSLSLIGSWRFESRFSVPGESGVEPVLGQIHPHRLECGRAERTLKPRKRRIARTSPSWREVSSSGRISRPS
jgi:hypothetical protein